MTFEEVVRARRTHKAYGSEPVDPEVLRELLDVARWAPNHHLTNPWRFRVLGPASLQRLKDAANAQQPGSGEKLDRAPTLVAVTSLVCGDDPVADEEDLLATGCAAFLVLLAAEARGLASYWRTPAVMRDPGGLRALGADPGRERGVGLLHLGPRRQEQPPPERAPLEQVASFLD